MIFGGSLFYVVTNVVLVVFFLFLVFKMLETKWSYKISKPFAWDESVSQNKVSKKLKSGERFYRDKVRFYTFWFQIERLKKENIPGAFAELGVYQGETARMIHEMDSTRVFHLFDTFTGFDKQDTDIDDAASKNAVDFSDTAVDMVKETIDGNDNIIIHKGFFPETTNQLTEEQFAFVHLDADLYPPTLAGLKYFYPRMSPGGVIMIHDYNHNWEGATRAVDEFIKTIPEQIVAVADWQGSAIIVKNK